MLVVTEVFVSLGGHIGGHIHRFLGMRRFHQAGQFVQGPGVSWSAHLLQNDYIPSTHELHLVSVGQGQFVGKIAWNMQIGLIGDSDRYHRDHHTQGLSNRVV